MEVKGGQLRNGGLKGNEVLSAELWDCRLLQACSVYHKKLNYVHRLAPPPSLEPLGAADCIAVAYHPTRSDDYHYLHAGN